VLPLPFPAIFTVAVRFVAMPGVTFVAGGKVPMGPNSLAAAVASRAIVSRTASAMRILKAGIRKRRRLAGCAATVLKAGTSPKTWERWHLTTGAKRILNARASRKRVFMCIRGFENVVTKVIARAFRFRTRKFRPKKLFAVLLFSK
jgi:hypothetical protein